MQKATFKKTEWNQKQLRAATSILHSNSEGLWKKETHTHTKHPPTTHMQAQCPHRTSEATVAEEAEIAFVITEDHSALKSHASLGAQFARAAVEAVLVAAPKGSLIRGFAEL